MRILHVVPSYIPAWRYGGPILSVHGLCKALAGRGHEIEVATTNVDGEGDSDVPLETAVDLDGVSVRYFRSRTLRRLYYSPPMRRFVENRMLHWDLIHTHSVFLWPTTMAARSARRFGKPYVVSPRGMLVRDLISRRSPLIKRAWIALFERRNIELAAAVHVTSAVEAEDLHGAGLHPARIFEIPNGVDDDTLSPDECRPLPSLPGAYALFLGRISWKKGLDRLVDALPHAAHLHVVVAGVDDEGYWPNIEKRAREAGVADRIQNIGFVRGRAKRELISRAALLVLPSYSENFGNVVMEALSIGTPVVVTAEVGLARVVASGRCGLVAKGEPESLGGALMALAFDPALRSEMSANAFRVSAAYSWEAIAERFEAEYRLVADRK